MKPPGYTCAAIDRALRTSRRLAWRLRRIGHVPDGQRAVDHYLVTKLLLSDLAAELEVVREENREMRAAWYAMREQLRATGYSTTSVNVPTTPA